jgi:citrate lyase beta subunit/biotin carboxylase
MFIPAHNLKLMESALKTDADILLLDLEDSVETKKNKQIARNNIKDYVALGKFKHIHVFPRVNDRESGELLKDIVELAIPGIDGFMYPKSNTGEDIYFIDKLLETIEYEKGYENGHFKIIPLIETTSSVLHAEEICKVSNRVIAIAFGCEDYLMDVDGVNDEEASTIFTARSLIAIAARSQGVIPIDTVHIKVHDLEDLEKNIMIAKKLGFEGMLVLHPKELELVHKYYSPTEKEVKDAKQMLEAYEKSQIDGVGVAIVNDKFIGPPLVRKAKKVLERDHRIREKNSIKKQNNFTKKKIMIIGAGILQVPAIIRAKELGYEVISADINPNAVGFKYADTKCVVSTNDIQGILKEAEKLEPDGVMTLATDMPVRSVAAVGEKLNLNTIDKSTAIRVTDKSEMRKFLKDKSIPIPQYYVVETFDDCVKASKYFKTSFIIKPSDSSGSRGVFLVENASQLYNAYKYSSQYSKNGKVLLEEYMIGPEVSVETFSIDGIVNIIAVTDKKTSGAPHFVELRHSIPSILEKEILLEIEKVAKMAVKTIGIENGPSHTEIIVTDEGPKIVEIGARLGGDNITTHLVPLSTGINIVDLNIKYALNEIVEIRKTLDKASCIQYVSAHTGKIKQISGIEEAKNINGVRVVELNKQNEDIIAEYESSHDRIGYVISQADNINEAWKICEDSCKKIAIEIID